MKFIRTQYDVFIRIDNLRFRFHIIKKIEYGKERYEIFLNDYNDDYFIDVKSSHVLASNLIEDLCAECVDNNISIVNC